MQKIYKFILLHFFVTITSLTLVSPLSAQGYSSLASICRFIARILTIPARQVVLAILEPGGFLMLVIFFVNSILWAGVFLSLRALFRVVRR